MVGGYLYDQAQKRNVLYDLARSANVWKRRTAIVSTYYFIRKYECDDTFRIVEILLHDGHDLIRKAVGGWVREAGKRDRDRLLGLLDQQAASMPRTALRYAIEKLQPALRDHYMGLQRTARARDRAHAPSVGQ